MAKLEISEYVIDAFADAVAKKIQGTKADALDEIRFEIVHLHDWAFSREEVLRIIDRYRAAEDINPPHVPEIKVGKKAESED